MYVIDRLNETILEQYHVVVSSNVNVYEVNHRTGEGKFITNYVNPDAKYVIEAEDVVDELLETIIDYVETIADMEVDEDAIYDAIHDEEEKVGFWLINTLNEKEHPPTEKEIEQWKDGSLFLYDHEIAFTVTINGAKISNEILQDLMFMHYQKASDSEESTDAE